MLGAVLGDIAGSRFEFTGNRIKPERLFVETCFPTDDSYLTLAVKLALSESLDNEEELELNVLKQTLVQYLRAPITAGWGAGFSAWCRGILARNNITTVYQVLSAKSLKYESNKSAGNGCAMKVSAVPYYSKSLEQCKELTKRVASVTHDHEDSYKAAECLTTSMYMAWHGKTRDQIRHNVLDYYPEVTDMSYSKLNEEYQYSELAKDTVPAAMVCFLESKSFEDCLKMAVSIGGDADTLGAIAGALAEAFYGWKKGEEVRMLDTWLEKLCGDYDFNVILLMSIAPDKNKPFDAISFVKK